MRGRLRKCLSAVAVASVLAAAAVSSTTAVAGAAGPESFAGYWYVHGGQLFIGSYSYKPSTGHSVTDWYGVRTESSGQGIETDLLTLSLSANGAQMMVTTLGATYMSGQTGAPAPFPSPKQNFVRGDSYVLEFAHPGLLKTVDIRTHIKDLIGNPYWCGSATPPQYQHYCGA